MPIDYVSDYEALTGRKPDGSPIEMETSGAAEAPVETKVIAAPAKPKVAHSAIAETA
jgi:hypothetical protein